MAKLKRLIMHNKIQCRKCGDIIESYTRHDFKFCECESVAVDGGKDYLSRSGEYKNWTELSVVEEVLILDDSDCIEEGDKLKKILYNRRIEDLRLFAIIAEGYLGKE